MGRLKSAEMSAVARERADRLVVLEHPSHLREDVAAERSLFARRVPDDPEDVLRLTFGVRHAAPNGEERPLVDLDDRDEAVRELAIGVGDREDLVEALGVRGNLVVRELPPIPSSRSRGDRAATAAQKSSGRCVSSSSSTHWTSSAWSEPTWPPTSRQCSAWRSALPRRRQHASSSSALVTSAPIPRAPVGDGAIGASGGGVSALVDAVGAGQNA